MLICIFVKEVVIEFENYSFQVVLSELQIYLVPHLLRVAHEHSQSLEYFFQGH